MGLLLLLGGCGGGDETKTASEVPKGYTVYESSEFSLQYAENWEVITPRDFVSEIPKGTMVGFQRVPKDEIFTPNIGVLKNELPKETPSIDYAKGLIQHHASALLNYKEISREEVNVGVGDTTFPSLFVIFEGKEKADADAKIFLQISVVKKQTAYLATAAYLKTMDDAMRSEMTQAVKSLHVK